MEFLRENLNKHSNKNQSLAQNTLIRSFRYRDFSVRPKRNFDRSTLNTKSR